MSQSLRVHHYLLARGRHYASLGRSAEAQYALERFLTQLELSPEAKAEAHVLLGEIEQTRGHFRRARRHFAAAIGLAPCDPNTYARYAAAIEADADADPRKGRAALRRAIGIDRTVPCYWTALGRLQLRSGKRKRAVRSFRRAAKLLLDSPALAEVVNGFVAAGREREARAVLTAARFRTPHDAGIVALWNQFRFDCSRRRQARTGRDDIAVLPFPGRTGAPAAAGASPVIIRADQRSRPKPHVLRLLSLSSDPRQAR